MNKETEEMSDGDMWRSVREDSQIKRKSNSEKSLVILHDHCLPKGIDVKKFSESHYRVLEWDYWPSTGKFKSLVTGKEGRGIFNLIKLIK